MSGLKYNASIDTNNFNNSHSLAFHFIKSLERENLQVLEVGCSAGYFGAALKADGHYVAGIEPDPQAAEEAKLVLDRVFCGYIEEFFALHEGAKFDIITFGDILEHLPAPEKVLRTSKSFLKPGGRIVISIPNVTHGCIRAMLLDGDWKYSKLGILDSTHLRFFSKEGIVDLVNNSGLKINLMQPVKLSVAAAAQICEIKINPRTLRTIESLSDETKQDFQYVILAEAGENSKEELEALKTKVPRKILVTSSDPTSNITELRILGPLRRLAWRYGNEIKTTPISDINMTDINWADLIVMQRGASKKAAQITRICKNRGVPLIYDIDDLLTEIPDFLTHHKDLIKNRSNIMECLENATVATVSTQRLAVALGINHKKTFICPNYAIHHTKPTSGNATKIRTSTIVFAASDRVKVDFILDALKHIQKKYKEQVDFLFIGPNCEKIRQHGLTGHFLEIIPYHQFRDFLSKLPNAIGAIPLDDSKFSSCKSSVKYFDYSQAGVATVCSNNPPYSDTITSGENGVLVENTESAWISALEGLIQDKERRQKIATNAQNFVATQHNIQRSVDAWSIAVNQATSEVTKRCSGEYTSINKIFSPSTFLTEGYWKIKQWNRDRKKRRREKNELQIK